MLGKSILLTGHDEGFGRLATASLRAAGNEVVVANDLDSALSLGHARAIDLALVRSDGNRTALIEFLSQRDVPVVLLTDAEHLADTLEHFTLGESNHVLALSADPAELLTTVEKILRGDTFGIQKYLQTFGVEMCTFEIRTALDIVSAAESIEDYLASLGARSDFGANMASAVNAMLTNAVLHAPRTAEGHRKYTKEQLTSGMTLEPGEYPILQYGCDGRRFVAAITDSFGSLRLNSIRAAIDRGLSRSRGDGATDPNNHATKPGLGIFTAFQLCRELVFNVHRDELTQCILSGDLFDWSKTASGAQHSIHIFEHRDAEPQHDQPTTDESVVLSDSMLFAIKDKAGQTMPAPILSLKPKRVDTARPVANWDEDSELFNFEPQNLGIDTMFGLIHGASTEKRVMELGLRFLTTIYEGAIAFRVKNAELHPWLATGRIRDWNLCKHHAFPLIARNVLTEAVRLKSSQAVHLNPDSIGDNELARYTCGNVQHPCVVASVVRYGRVTHVLFGFHPRFKRAIAGKVLRSLAQELKEALNRIAQDSAPIYLERVVHQEATTQRRLRMSSPALVAVAPASAGLTHAAAGSGTDYEILETDLEEISTEMAEDYDTLEVVATAKTPHPTSGPRFRRSRLQ